MIDPVLFSTPDTYDDLNDESLGSFVRHIHSRNPNAFTDGHIGEINRFGSQVLGSDFDDLLGSLQLHCDKNAVDPRDIFIWLCEFCLDFPVPSTAEMKEGKGDDYDTIFKKNISV